MRLLDDLHLDVRYAMRSWLRSPGWLAAAVISIGLGVGAATTVLGSVDRMLRRPPAGLEHVVAVLPERAGAPVPTTAADLRALEGVAAVELAGYRRHSVSAGTAALERVGAAAVSSAFFRVTGAAPLIGTVPDPLESGVVVVSEAFWRSRLAADPRAVGSPLRVDGASLTVVAVLPAEFVFPATDVALWLPLDAAALEDDGALALVARLRAGFGLAAAESELAARLSAAGGEPRDPREAAVGGEAGEAGDARGGREAGDARGARDAREAREAREADEAAPAAVRLRPVQALYLTETLRSAARIAVATVVFVLLIACANVASLLLARGVARRRELAVRRSLGASRGRLLRQLLAESAVVAALGGVLGVVAAAWGAHGLMLLWAGLPDTRPFPEIGTIDVRQLAIAAGVTMAATLLFGLFPALHGSRPTAARTAGTATGSGRAQRSLVVAQVALALSLVASSTLLAQSFLRIQSAELGFGTEHVLSFGVAGLEPPAQLELAERLRAVPGVLAAGAAESLPLEGAGRRAAYRMTGAVTGDATWNAPLRVVTPGYFEALGIAVLRGRVLGAEDRAGAPNVAVVNRAFAARHALDAGAAGHALLIDGEVFDVAGVVADTREWGPHADGPPIIYVAAEQAPAAGPLVYVVRAAPDAPPLDGLLRGVVAAVNADAMVHDVAPLRTRLRENTARSQLITRVMAIFAGIALLLAIAGVHATVAHATLRRVPELAVRRALGATRGGIVALVLRQGLSMVLAGMAAGALLAFGAARLLARFLVGVSAADGLSLLAAALAMVLAAAAACLGPALRAGRVAPMQALHDESHHWSR